jgi:hypothetical protein
MNGPAKDSNPWQNLVRDVFHPESWDLLSADVIFAEFWRAKVQSQSSAMYALGWAANVLSRKAKLASREADLQRVADLVEAANSASSADMNLLEFRQYAASAGSDAPP